jgi:hypothetical protein
VCACVKTNKGNQCPGRAHLQIEVRRIYRVHCCTGPEGVTQTEVAFIHEVTSAADISSI